MIFIGSGREQNEGGPYDQSEEPARSADVDGDNTRPSSHCSIDDLARHHCPISRYTAAAPVLQHRTRDCGTVVDRDQQSANRLHLSSATWSSGDSLVTG